MSKIDILNIITIDKNGLPTPPSLKQLLDKDVRELYIRDRSNDKSMYFKECCFIYYIADPESPPNQQGCSYNEAAKMAIEMFDLPKDYEADALVSKLITLYYDNAVGEAGKAIETLRKALHNVTTASIKINDILNAQLLAAITVDDIAPIMSYMDAINKRVGDIPVLTKKLEEAYDNLRYEKETVTTRGGKKLSKSMDAEAYVDEVAKEH